ncbi:methyltransferase domain-containing protein [Litorihabitans aurantiacus]|uniref:23S rRNA (Uracil(747)-C(5))-methyltransferase n=1 Tax=Litorihabitans aurantiacus TaxID=1930061 RepID=A0AA37XDR8_9MICO|nr:methyltransferase domain-containing protein [Litorihabitans aurantiacus]GMA30782.1 23S rRNA (uracil(747)-C(5))-methyltransferase [Litorihabitans aurantiacus]
MRCDYLERDLCRSCTLLHLPPVDQLATKVAGVRDALADLNLPDDVWRAPVMSPEQGFRNKAKMVVGGTAAAPVLGIQAVDGPRGAVSDLTRCPLHAPAIERALPALAAFVTTASLTPYDLVHRRGELKHLLVTANEAGDLMVRFVLRSREAEVRIRKHLPALRRVLPRLAVVSLNIHPEHAAVLEGPHEIVLHGETLTMTVNDLPLHLRPRSFFQTNTAVAAALYRNATDWLTSLEPRTLWDLYCGVGGFALHAAAAMPTLEVLGVEVSRDAVASAGRTAADLGLARARFRADDATDVALGDPAAAPDVVVVNPPRRGIGPGLAAWLETSRARHVLYSSCNATTLARDLAAMPSLRVKHAQVLDMFPHTTHSEVLVGLTRRPG